jgi:hypothetical protein
MNKKLRTYLELSVWIILLVVVWLPKPLDKTITLPLIYLLILVVTVLGVDSIWQIIQMARGNYKVPYSEEIVKSIADASFFRGATTVLKNRQVGKLTTAEELQQNFNLTWDDIKIKSDRERMKEEDLKATKAVDELLN